MLQQQNKIPSGKASSTESHRQKSSYNKLLEKGTTVSVHHVDIQALVIKLFKVKNGFSTCRAPISSAGMQVIPTALEIIVALGYHI